MLTLPRVVALLRFAIVGLFGLLVVFEALSLPGQFLNHEHVTSRVFIEDLVFTLLGISWVVSLQIALLMAWRLLRLFSSERIFTSAVLGPMDVVVRVSGYVVVSTAALFLYIGAIADDPGGPFALLLLSLCVAVAHLLTRVLRDVLRRAVALVQSA